MAQVTLDGGQSAAAVAGLTPTYIQGLALQQLPGCPDSLVASHLQLVLKQFYTFTLAWREIVGPYQIEKSVDSVILNPVDQNKQVQFVLDAWTYPTFGGETRQWLAPATRRLVGIDKNLPSSYFMETPEKMILYPLPDQDYGNILWVYAALIPTVNAAVLPNITFTHHLDAIVHGLLARLYRMPKKPWTDPQAAADNKRGYSREMIVWRAHADRNYGPRGVPTVFPPFSDRHNQMSAKAVLG